MILIGLAVTAWVGAVLAQTQPQLWWLAVVLASGLAWLIRKSGIRTITALALATGALVIGAAPLLGASLNPKLVSQAAQFQERFVSVEVQLGSNNYSAKARIEEPLALRGKGWVQLSAQTKSEVERLGCQRILLVGRARLMPASNRLDAENQFRAAFTGISASSCSDTGVLGRVSQLTDWTQKRARQAATGISSQAAALVLGLTNGDDSSLLDSVKEDMKLLSLTHLTAVSGTNCTIVVLSLFFAAGLAGLGRGARVMVAGLGLIGYLVLVGPEPSVLRASVMSLIGLLALVGGRQKSALSFLGLAVLALLIVDSSLALSLGFALSATATFGVIWLAPRLALKLQTYVPAWLATLTAATLAAQLCCLPILVTLQSEFSAFAVLANVLVEPLVPAITVLGVGGAVLALIWPALGSPLFWLASVAAQAILSISGWLASINISQKLPGHLLGIVLASLLLLAVVLWVLDQGRLARIGAVLLALLFLGFGISDLRAGIQSNRFAQGDWVYVACDVGQGDATVIRSNDQIAVIDVGPDPKLIDSCLKSLGIRRIDLLVLSHFDRDHVGGLMGALQGRSVDLGLITQFPDERPAAGFFTDLLERSARQVIPAEKGLKGSLGYLRWSVLSPHHNGEDSEDSNDGSITMTFEAPKFWILTLADLGEKGQMRLVQERGSWYSRALANKPLILKVSHHGSADEYSEFMHWLKPAIATISVGANNSYGHPTRRLLDDLNQPQLTLLRTDQLGSISVVEDAHRTLGWASASAR
ncbi:MAG: ComEC/Rec2 family competence protein [Micrococcales bacterium]